MAADGAAPAVAVAKAAGAAPAVAAIAPAGAPVADPRAAALALINTLPDAASERVLALQREKKRLADEKKRVAKEEKKEKQKRQRLIGKAKGLTNDDLVTIIAGRAAVAKAKAN